VDFFWSEAEVADQKIAYIMGIIHAAPEWGGCIAVNATENGFACHGSDGVYWWEENLTAID
jgi:hypothetical protein